MHHVEQLTLDQGNVERSDKSAYGCTCR